MDAQANEPAPSLADLAARLRQIDLGDGHDWVGNFPAAVVEELFALGLVYASEPEYLGLSIRGDELLALVDPAPSRAGLAWWKLRA